MPSVRTAALLAINLSECYATTSFLKGDFWTGIASEWAVTQG
jgi:hypothetical protein